MALIEPAVLAPSEAVTIANEPNSEARGPPGGDITTWKLVVYSLPSIPLASLYLPVAILLPAFYGSTLHVSLAAIGGFLLASRALDFILDPMIGKWSDSTPPRFGRRKIWMIMGTPLLMLGAWLLFMPPVAPNGWYLMASSFIIYAGGSMVGLTYAAWGTEIVETYHGRSRMAGFREAFGVIGGLMAAAIPAFTSALGHNVDRFTMGILGWMIIVLTPVTVLVAVTLIAEPAAPRMRISVPWLRSIREMLHNGPFRIFCGAYVLFSLGGGVVNATMVFYMTDFLRAPNIVGPALLASSISTIAAVPLWLRISRRIGKHRAITLSLFAAIVVFALVVPFLGPGQGWGFVAILGVLGAISAGYVTLPVGIIGDVIDYDTLKHRLPRGGIYWGVWSFAQKVAPALAIGVTLPTLKLLGFNPGGPNTPAALLALKDSFCFVVIPFLLAGGLLLWQFPIDARRHDLIRRRLETRQRRDRLESLPKTASVISE